MSMKYLPAIFSIVFTVACASFLLLNSSKAVGFLQNSSKVDDFLQNLVAPKNPAFVPDETAATNLAADEKNGNASNVAEKEVGQTKKNSENAKPVNASKKERVSAPKTVQNQAPTVKKPVAAQPAVQDPVPANVAAAGLFLNVSSRSLTVGFAEQLIATIVPASATNKNVTWSSSNPAAATVNANARVVAVAAGLAIISAVADDGGYTATATITVQNPAIVEPQAAGLTRQGIIDLTNAQRLANIGAGYALTGNSVLDQAADKKVQDMFDGQYFEHTSPTGVTAVDLINSVGYRYAFCGENLAQGTYKSDAQVVDAWMNSPGHRANILKTDFTQIGVGVGYGMFNGRNMWLVVQEFGTPR